MNQNATLKSNGNKTVIIMAGGTGGHIFPGLALAHELRKNNWTVHWLGSPHHMEAKILADQPFAFEAVEFSGVRGKGKLQTLTAPWRLMKACVQAYRVLRKVEPKLIIGFGGYITVPASLVALFLNIPVWLHEQNSVAGMANRLLSKWAKQVFSAFPGVLPRAQWVGNPLRSQFSQQPVPSIRFQNRQGPLKILVVGGSLGAQALNEYVPKALALIPASERPQVLHQAGAQHLTQLQKTYADVGVVAETTAFIEDTAQAFAQADLIICRAGASTVTEIAAVGAAALFVPFPHAVDDHQTVNANYLVQHQAAYLMPQHQMSAEKLAKFIQATHRSDLLSKAENAYQQRKINAATTIANHAEKI